MATTTPATDPTAGDPTATDHTALRRALGLGGLTLFGLAYLVPLTVFTTYGIVTETTGGRVALAYLFTLAAMAVTAVSYARMVRAHPVAGSAYTYTRRTFGAPAGFLTGWALLLDYLFLPMINHLVIGIYLNAAVPGVPLWAWVLVSLALVTVLNLLGITSIARASTVIVAAQVVFVVVFVLLAVRGLAGADVSLAAPFAGDGSVAGLAPVLAGAAVLCLSFLGFDAVSTMAEEARRPRVDIPRAILLVTVLGGVLFVLLSWLAQVAVPATTFPDADAAAVDVMTEVGGTGLSAFFTAAYVAGAFGSALTSQASVCRILFSMGRDGVLPRVLGRVWERRRTPAVSVLVVTVASLLVLVLDLATLASLISFGALIAFTAVNVAVVKHYWVDEKERGPRAVLLSLVLPLVGVALTVWLWTSLSGATLLVGLAWLAVGALWLLWVSRGFRRPLPESSMDEHAVREDVSA
ncbi:APC family permease [Oryzobacter sp. R7]|uniref:APC family permease n=1 Tax=Oryzobacter faecalis TaxID=3388656 RepID=UPI00398D59FF